jgi:hypothetical protein
MPADSYRIKRLRIVEEALDPDEVGDITVSRPWIKASLIMSWGFIDDERRAVWFLGKASGISIVMGGSAKHLLGSVDAEQQPHYAYSLLPVLTKALIERTKVGDESIEDFGQMPEVVAAARLLVDTASGPRERLSFLARRLMTASENSGKLILATPLYVASSPT